jgi:RNA:NAD 2'-phosphotransferase (TPT1/KptA family)
VSKCLRHSDVLPTNSAAFAWIDDVTFTVWQGPKRYRNLKRRLTIQEVLYVVDATEEGRFQVTFQTDSDSPYTGVIRAVQGYSGPIHSWIKAQDAYERIAEVKALVHYTSQAWLPNIIGVDGLGLIPGGQVGTRGYVYISQKLPARDGTLPSKLKKRGTDVAIHLNAEMVTRDIALSVSAERGRIGSTNHRPRLHRTHCDVVRAALDALHPTYFEDDEGCIADILPVPVVQVLPPQ